MATPSSPAAESDFKRAWEELVSAIKGGEASLGERLYLLGAGPVPVEGAAGGALTLDASGGVVLVVGLASPVEGAADQIAHQLSAIAGLPGAKLREAGVDPAEGGGLAARHAAFFDLESPVDMNTGQRSIVVLGAEPETDGREALEATLGTSLAGLFVATEDGVTGVPAAQPEAEAPAEEIVLEPEAPAEAEAPEEAEVEAEVPAEEDVDLDVPGLETPEEVEPEGPDSVEADLDAPPEEATEERATVVITDAADAAPDLVTPYLEDESTTVIAEEADAAAEGTGVSAWPIGNWIGLTMIVVGIGLAVLGVMTWGKSGDSEPQGLETNDEIRTVVTGVTPDATHARWIGQQRVVTLADGTLVFVYPTETSLNFVEDGASSGASWDEEPFVVEDVVGAESLSVDVDSKDRLHVAYSDGASVNYVRLKNKPSGWKPSRLIQIDDDTTSLHVDVAWDEENQTAHVVWVQQTDDGEAPAWAALTNESGIHLTQEGTLADPGTEVPVLANVTADGQSSLLITYRRGDQTTGWSSRYSPGRSTDGEWLFNEEEQVATASFIGAADVLYDGEKSAHLVLRDDDAHTLAYFTKAGGEPWSEGEVAYRGEQLADADFPTLSYNTGEENLYLFFQTEEAHPAGEIGYVLHPVGGTGWQGTFDIALDGDAPEGALYPVAPDRTSVQTIVLWTTTGEIYQVDSAPVIPPP